MQKTFKLTFTDTGFFPATVLINISFECHFCLFLAVVGQSKLLQVYSICILLAGVVVSHQQVRKLQHTPFSLSLLKRTRGVNTMRLGWVEIRTRESLSNYCCGQSRLSTGRLIYCQTREVGNKSRHTCPLSTLFLPSSEQEWELQSVHNALSLLFLHCCSLPLFQGGIPPTGCCPS